MNRRDILQELGYRQATRGSVDMLLRSHPLSVIEYISNRIGEKSKVLCEIGCGVGVSLESYVPYFKSVIGLDNDISTLSACRNNLKFSNLASHIDLILGDATDQEIIKRIKADIVIFDIPRREDIPKDEADKIIISMLFNIRDHITPHIVGFSKPSYTFAEIKKMLKGIPIEYQKLYVDGKHYTNLIYSGELIEQPGKTEVRL